LKKRETDEAEEAKEAGKKDRVASPRVASHRIGKGRVNLWTYLDGRALCIIPSTQ
jgi:hypothetical protein